MTTKETIEQVEREYIETHSRSKELHERAKRNFASGVTHDSRYMEPFPVYATRASGSKKWDVDGNEYIDYVMGHGALLFGYGDDDVQRAFRETIERGVHMGSSTEMEIEWAELIQSLVPCASDGLVRACSSGSEAVSVAIRLARAHTGNDKIVLQAGAYHGKDDQVNYVYNGPPFEHRNIAGIPSGVKENVEMVPFNDLDAVESAFASGNVACVLLHSNNLYEPGYVEGLRELATEYGVVFAMDEVVSGFRYAPGGAQEYYDIVPDLAILGKIVGGGSPIGAVCGKREIMKYHEFRDDEYWNNFQRISVGGTWNAQPISIAGGIAAMRTIKENRSEIYPRLSEVGSELVRQFNDHAEDLGVSALANGVPPEDPVRVSVHLFAQQLPDGARRLFQTGPESFEEYETKRDLYATDAERAFNLSMLNNGIFGHSKCLAFVPSTAHTDADLEETGAAMRESLAMLKRNGLVGDA